VSIPVLGRTSSMAGLDSHYNELIIALDNRSGEWNNSEYILK
jgi:hypothetical protein